MFGTVYIHGVLSNIDKYIHDEYTNELDSYILQ